MITIMKLQDTLYCIYTFNHLEIITENWNHNTHTIMQCSFTGYSNTHTHTRISIQSIYIYRKTLTLDAKRGPFRTQEMRPSIYSKYTKYIAQGKLRKQTAHHPKVNARNSLQKVVWQYTTHVEKYLDKYDVTHSSRWLQPNQSKQILVKQDHFPKQGRTSKTFETNHVHHLVFLSWRNLCPQQNA